MACDRFGDGRDALDLPWRLLDPPSMNTTRSRAWRRAQRLRVIGARAYTVLTVTGRPFWASSGKLSKHNQGLGCPDGRNCPFCHSPYAHARSRREVQAEIAAQTP